MWYTKYASDFFVWRFSLHCYDYYKCSGKFYKIFAITENITYENNPIIQY